jgi:primosomal protein N' (replication factor Y) (superfamily II helicase)
MKFAEVALTQKTGKEYRNLTYEIPDNLEISNGDLVELELRNAKKTGIVWQTTDKKPEFRTKKILNKPFSKAILDKNQLKLINWMSKQYFTPINQLLKIFIPNQIFKQTKSRIKKEKIEQIKRTPLKELSKEQKSALDSIITSKENKFLIQGVTGSGKTEVYTQLSKHFLDQGKQVLILVPEISLTPQTISYFEKSLGLKAEILNSKITPAKKKKSWEKIWKDEAKLVIGSRSAVFAPFQNLGLIVVDEEHESSYKQDNAPRYHTHEIIDKIIEFTPSIKALYGSATPSIETCERLNNSTYYLSERINSTPLPEVEIIDLRDEFKKKNYSIFSDSLKEEIEKTLKAKLQIILFINRRGSASSVVCRDCGHKELCDHCETTLTFHSKTLSAPSLICHHCGKITQPKDTCPNCKGPHIRFLGIGTQRIEADLVKEFPQARVLRADKDTTANKNGFEEIYNKFKNHEADILIGTQMIAKGLHLPKVRLVGVILADIGMNIPDFRSTEKTFQLMTQVAGRAGRAKERGKVIIQTYNPDNVSLTCAKEHDVNKFISYERQQRKLMKNPPFSKLIKILVEDPFLKNCERKTQEIENKLWHFAREHEKAKEIDILSYPAYLARYKGKYRFIILIKYFDQDFIEKDSLENILKDYIMAREIKIDPSPITVS